MSAKYIFVTSLCLGIIFLSSGKDTVLYCQRSTDTCNLTQTGLLWSTTRQIPLHKLRGATSTGEDEPKKVIITTSDEKIPMTDIAYSPGGQAETTRQINEFVRNNDRKFLRVYENTVWMSIVLGIFLIIFGAGMLLMKETDLSVE